MSLLDLHAILALLPLFVVGQMVAHCGGLPSRKDLPARFAVLFLFGFVVLGTLFPVYTHCGVRGPELQVMVPWGCSLITLFLVRPLVPALIAFACMSTLAATEDTQYMKLLGAPEITERSPRFLQQRNQTYFKFDAGWVQATAEELKDGKRYAAGWLDEIPRKELAESAQDAISAHAPRDLRVTELWHSRFTGLRKVESRPVRLWFTGGTMKDLERKVVAVPVDEPYILGTGPGRW